MVMNTLDDIINETNHLSDKIKEEKELKDKILSLSQIDKLKLNDYIKNLNNGDEMEKNELVEIDNAIINSEELTKNYKNQPISLRNTDKFVQELTSIQKEYIQLVPEMLNRTYKNFKENYKIFKKKDDVDARKRAKENAKKFLFFCEVGERYGQNIWRQYKKKEKCGQAISEVENLKIQEDRSKDRTIDELKNKLNEIEGDYQKLQNILETEKESKENLQETSEVYKERVDELEKAIKNKEEEKKKFWRSLEGKDTKMLSKKLIQNIVIWLESTDRKLTR